MEPAAKYIRWFSELGIDDVPIVGGKNTSLGEMYRELTAKGVSVPNGFAVTAQAYRYAMDSANMHRLVCQISSPLDRVR